MSTLIIFLMGSRPVKLTYEINLQPGEQLSLPPELTASIGAGCWLVTIQSAPTSSVFSPTRSHNAFLNSYAPEDEGRYDDYLKHSHSNR